MSGAAEVMAAVTRRATVRYVALVPNRKGAELALAADMDALTVTVSASPAYNQRNVHMTVDQSVAAVADIAEVVGARALPVDAVVSCAFGSPYEGDIDPGEVHRLGERLREAGASSLTYADTTGMATPRRIRELLDWTGPEVGLHLHDTRGTALVNAYAALQTGVTRFDTATGGIGGSPFAAGAGGNLATEDFVHLLDDLGVQTGVSLEGVLSAAALLGELVAHPLPSRVAAFGPRHRLAAE